MPLVGPGDDEGSGGRAMQARLTRAQVPEELTWNLADIYATQDDWEADLQRVEAAIATVTEYQGRLGEGAATMLACLRARDVLRSGERRVGKECRSRG